MSDNIKGLWALVFLTVGFLMGTYSSDAKASVKLAPPVFCTMANRLDIFIDEDNIMWACECEALKSGHICRWQVIGGVDAVNSRRYRKLHPRAKAYRIKAYTVPPILVRVR